MSIVSNILEALRRIGSPSEKSALRRQDEQLQGRDVLERGRIVARLGDETAVGFHASVEPSPEVVTILDNAEIESINKNASLAPSLFEDFGIAPATHLLDKLDQAFAMWLRKPDELGFSEADVVEIFGAAFGNYCNETLDMRWVSVSDEYGVSLAIDGREFEFRGYPYSSIQKRIADSEHTFFRSIYILLAHQKENSRRRTAAA